MIYWIVTNRWAQEAKPLINPIVGEGDEKVGMKINHSIGGLAVSEA